MGDILSGGRIDESTSGPTPPSGDDRDRDILLQQKEKRDQDAVGGTQFPPRAQPPPPIPEAVEVAPPLPVIPSFDFNFSGSALEEFREISRQTTMDILKNVNINGRGPSFEGSTIAFNIPQETPASEAFIFQGVMVAQPLPPSQAIQATVLPQMAQIEPAQEIQSVVVATPTRQQPAPKVEAESIQGTEASESIQPVLPQAVALSTTIPTLPTRIESTVEGSIENATIEAPLSLSLTQEPTFLEPAKSPTEILESDIVLSLTEPPLEKTQPVRPPQSKEANLPSKPEDNEDEDFTPRYTRLSDYPTFEAETTQDESQKNRNEARNRGADIGFDNAAEIREEARNRGADIGFDNAAEEREEVKENRKKNDPNFDPESDIRQQGETMSEYKERQEKLEQKEIEKADIVEGEAILTRESSGAIAVSLIRADGEGEVFATFRSDVSSESGPTLPKSQYYVGVPNGANKGDLLYWNPDMGSEGRWAILQAPQTGKATLKVLTIQNDTLAWTDTEDCE